MTDDSVRSRGSRVLPWLLVAGVLAVLVVAPAVRLVLVLRADDQDPARVTSAVSLLFFAWLAWRTVVLVLSGGAADERAGYWAVSAVGYVACAALLGAIYAYRAADARFLGEVAAPTLVFTVVVGLLAILAVVAWSRKRRHRRRRTRRWRRMPW